MEITLKPAEIQLLMLQFNRELEKLSGTDLLEKKATFDKLPRAADGEEDLRLQQSLSLEACLQSRFGFGWKKALGEYLEGDADA